MSLLGVSSLPGYVTLLCIALAIHFSRTPWSRPWGLCIPRLHAHDHYGTHTTCSYVSCGVVPAEVVAVQTYPCVSWISLTCFLLEALFKKGIPFISTVLYPLVRLSLGVSFYGLFGRSLLSSSIYSGLTIEPDWKADIISSLERILSRVDSRVEKQYEIRQGLVRFLLWGI